MKQLVRLTLAALALTASLTAATHAEEVKKLHLYNWADYMDPEIIKNFETEYKCDVVEDFYDSAEDMMAKLQAGGLSQYDLVGPSNVNVPSFIRLKLLMELDKSKLPNLRHLDPAFSDSAYDPGNKYTAPYLWGTIGLLYRKDKLPDFKPTWGAVLDADKQPGTFLLLDSVRDMLDITLIYQGKAINSTDKGDLKAIADMLVKAKKSKNFAGFEPGVGGKNKVAAGVASIGIVWNGDALQVMKESEENTKNMAFVLPKEGSIKWVDTIGIPAKAPNPELAHAFINYLYEPKVAAQLANFVQYATPNAAAKEFLTPEDLANPVIYPTEEQQKKLHISKDLGEQNKLYDQVWTMVKSR
jgi:spermidine/putrescine transport system substrate-binding protein